MNPQTRIGKRLKLRDLHTLSAIAETGNMSRAASLLGVSNPVVSKTITDLEQSLGVRILDRTPQRAEPTVYGRALMKCGVIVFDELRRVVQEIGFLSGTSSGELRIGSIPPYLHNLVAMVVERLCIQHPMLTFRVTEAGAVTLCGLLRDRKLDLVIGRVSSAVMGEDLVADDLFDEAMCVVAGSRSPLSRRRHVRLADLVGERWIMPESDNIAMSIIAEGFASLGLRPPAPQVVSNSMALRMRLIESGTFVGILPRSSLRLHAGKPRVKILPTILLANSPPAVSISVKNRTPNPAAKLFVDELRGCAQGLALTKRDSASDVRQPTPATRRSL